MNYKYYYYETFIRDEQYKYLNVNQNQKNRIRKIKHNTQNDTYGFLLQNKRKFLKKPHVYNAVAKPNVKKSTENFYIEDTHLTEFHVFKSETRKIMENLKEGEEIKLSDKFPREIIIKDIPKNNEITTRENTFEFSIINKKGKLFIKNNAKNNGEYTELFIITSKEKNNKMYFFDVFLNLQKDKDLEIPNKFGYSNLQQNTNFLNLYLDDEDYIKIRNLKNILENFKIAKQDDKYIIKKKINTDETNIRKIISIKDSILFMTISDENEYNDDILINIDLLETDFDIFISFIAEIEHLHIAGKKISGYIHTDIFYVVLIENKYYIFNEFMRLRELHTQPKIEKYECNANSSEILDDKKIDKVFSEMKNTFPKQEAVKNFMNKLFEQYDMNIRYS